ncbi:tyrosine-protein phosphatase [Deinococcus apachensis]|uniref:tyrosine-protein phosphatase n=1 Tax=Deinococcus apachensis TaxID=309886 RepID=UPI000375D546|nr:tyrosine-protein phosphatase [Deinococcus apachensis]
MIGLEARRLPWDACHNARDLGGLPTFDGRVVRSFALMRSDNHDRLTSAGQAAVRAREVSLILDLRNAWESRRFPSRFLGDSVYLNLPVLDDADEESYARVNAAPHLGAVYRTTVDGFARQLGEIIAVIADAPAGGVVLHCHAGNDRTGIVVALALAVAGVAPGVIAEDYALSDTCLAPHYAAELAGLNEVRRERVPRWEHSRPEVMLDLLDHLQQVYGGVNAYLRGAGVRQDQLQALRDRPRERP